MLHSERIQNTGCQMSHRFPPIASPKPTTYRARVRVLPRPHMPSLPWVELAIGIAFLLMLSGV